MTTATLENNLQNVIDYLDNLDSIDLVNIHNIYCEVKGFLNDIIFYNKEEFFNDIIFYNNEEFFDEFFSVNTFKAVKVTVLGDYNLSHDYVIFNEYGNLDSFNDLCDFVSKFDIAESILETPDVYDIELISLND